jgi:hypothetical protein
VCPRHRMQKMHRLAATSDAAAAAAATPLLGGAYADERDGDDGGQRGGALGDVSARAWLCAILVGLSSLCVRARSSLLAPRLLQSLLSRLRRPATRSAP